MDLSLDYVEPKTDPLDLLAIIYGDIKIGKSSWCAKAPGAFFILTEPGHNYLRTRRQSIVDWRQFLEVCAALATPSADIQNVVIDTVDNLYSMCSAHVCREKGIEHESDLNYGKGWSFVSGEFKRAINRLAMLPYGIYFISHSRPLEIETRTGKITKMSPSLPKGGRTFILGLVDLVLYATAEDEDTRVIHTQPSVEFEAGDRTGRLPATLPLLPKDDHSDFQYFIKAFKGEL